LVFTLKHFFLINQTFATKQKIYVAYTPKSNLVLLAFDKDITNSLDTGKFVDVLSENQGVFNKVWAYSLTTRVTAVQ